MDQLPFHHDVVTASPKRVALVFPSLSPDDARILHDAFNGSPEVREAVGLVLELYMASIGQRTGPLTFRKSVIDGNVQALLKE